MIYITGDTHGLKDIDKFNSKYFRDTVDKKENYLIITGDVGITWNNETMKKAVEIINGNAIVGNNENFDILEKFPVSKYCGGNVHKLGKNIYHLMRGEIFDIDGISFLAFGGADSWDAPHRCPQTSRVEGISFWKRERPSKAEFENAMNNLEKHQNKVDIILTHEGPSKIAKAFYSGSYATSKMLDIILGNVKYKYWFCGHHHHNRIFEEDIKCIFDCFDCVNDYIELPAKLHTSKHSNENMENL